MTKSSILSAERRLARALRKAFATCKARISLSDLEIALHSKDVTHAMRVVNNGNLEDALQPVKKIAAELFLKGRKDGAEILAKALRRV